MLTGITLKNFKSIKEVLGLETRPITIFCGANSCGKSSILQSILLMKQTKEGGSTKNTLLLNGGCVRLGGFDNIIFDRVSNGVISIGFNFEFDSEKFYSTIENNKPSIYPVLNFLIPKDMLINGAQYVLKIEITLDSDGRTGVASSGHVRSYKAAVYNKKHEKVVSSISMEPDHNGYRIDLVNIPDAFGPGGNITESFSEVSIGFEGLTPDIETGLIMAGNLAKFPFAAFNFIKVLDSFLNGYFRNISYIGPLREEPSRRYIYDNEVDAIGVKGQNAPYVFHAEQDMVINGHYFLDRDGSYKVVEAITLKNALSSWFDLMGISGFSPESNSDVIKLNLDAREGSSTRVSIVDVGFGVSQVFPILLEGLRMKRHKTLVLEQPEIHLHPNLQMQLADYFICMALSGKSSMIETHSDHLVNRMVRRIVEDETGEISKMIAIYFVKGSNHGAIFENIKIDPNRGILNWPEDFFDQTAKEQAAIISAGLQKRARLRSKKVDQE